MRKQYSLSYLTVNGCAPPEMTYIAARTGYDFVSLRLIPLGDTRRTALAARRQGDDQKDKNCAQ
jgi:hypothetical protein